MKYKIGTAAVLLCCMLSGTAGVTWAYLTDEDHADNRISTSAVETKIVEEYEKPEDPSPGVVIKKAPRIESSSDVDCYVRIRAIFTNDGNRICEQLKINDGWILKDDGYYYWDSVLGPGERTGTLFDQVSIKKDIREGEIKPFDILVYSESVQASDLTAQEAWSAMDHAEGGE